MVLNHQAELEAPVPFQVVVLELKSDSFLGQSCMTNPRPLRFQYHHLFFLVWACLRRTDLLVEEPSPCPLIHLHSLLRCHYCSGPYSLHRLGVEEPSCSVLSFQVLAVLHQREGQSLTSYL